MLVKLGHQENESVTGRIAMRNGRVHPAAPKEKEREISL